MTRQIEKLGLTVKQYTVLGTVMMVSCTVLGACAFFVADNSLFAGIVLAVVAVEFGFVGYCSLKVSVRLSECDDRKTLDDHRASGKSRRNMTAVSTPAAIVLIACVVCAVTSVCFKPKEEADAAIVTETNIEKAAAPETEVDAEAIEEEILDVVYATPTGKRYHYSARCAGSSCFAITMQEAQNHSLTPCKNCVIE